MQGQDDLDHHWIDQYDQDQLCENLDSLDTQNHLLREMLVHPDDHQDDDLLKMKVAMLNHHILARVQLAAMHRREYAHQKILLVLGLALSTNHVQKSNFLIGCYGLVVQRIGHTPAKGVIRVRFPTRPSLQCIIRVIQNLKSWIPLK